MFEALSSIPAETISGGIGAAMGAFITMKAQQHAMLMETLQGAIAVSKGDNNNQNDAAKRGSPWLRAVIGIIIIVVSFGGLLLAMYGGYETTVMEKTPERSALFGLIEWGGKLKPVSAAGFVIPPYIPASVAAVVGFLFGAAAANVMAMIKRR